LYKKHKNNQLILPFKPYEHPPTNWRHIVPICDPAGQILGAGGAINAISNVGWGKNENDN